MKVGRITGSGWPSPPLALFPSFIHFIYFPMRNVLLKVAGGPDGVVVVAGFMHHLLRVWLVVLVVPSHREFLDIHPIPPHTERRAQEREESMYIHTYIE